MVRRDLDSEALRSLLEPFDSDLRSPSEHEAGWFATLVGGDPLVQHLRGQTTLDGPELRRASLNTACGVSQAIVSIQERMAAGSRDLRWSERKRLVKVAHLPTTPPTGVDREAWRQLGDLHDLASDAATWTHARQALLCLQEDDPAGFARLMAAARVHDRAVDQLEPLLVEIEDSFVFSAAARALWSRFLGSQKALPQLPAHAALFALSVVFEPIQNGALVASLGLLAIAPNAEFHVEPVRSGLRAAVDRSLRFWQERSGGDTPGDGAAHAREFVAAVGDLVRAEQEAGVRIVERAAELGRRRRTRAFGDAEPPPPEGMKVMIHRDRGARPPVPMEWSRQKELEVIPFARGTGEEEGGEDEP